MMLWTFFGPGQYFLNDVDIVESHNDAGDVRLAFADGSVLHLPAPAYDILDRRMARVIAQIQQVFDVKESWFTKGTTFEEASGDDGLLRGRRPDR